MTCTICGAGFEFIRRDFKYLKKPIGVTIVSNLFRCRGNVEHFYQAIETETLVETRQKQKLKRLEDKKKRIAGGKELPYNPEITKPYSQRTDLGEPTEDEKRIADRTKDMTLEELKAMCR